MTKQKKGAAIAAPHHYAGPDYTDEIRVPTSPARYIDPRLFTPEQILELIQVYPPASEWWKPTASETSDSDSE